MIDLTDCLDNKIEKALKDKDIKNIMHKASSKFMKNLDSDIIYTCQINALWKAFVNFKPEKKTKFTTYLYKGVMIECIKAAKFESKNKCTNKLHDNITARSDNTTLLFDLLDELDNVEDKELLMDKFNNMTIEEMAHKRTYSRETVRKKLKKIYSHIRNGAI